MVDLALASRLWNAFRTERSWSGYVVVLALHEELIPTGRAMLADGTCDAMLGLVPNGAGGTAIVTLVREGESELADRAVEVIRRCSPDARDFGWMGVAS